MRYGKIRPQTKVLDHWQVFHEYEVTGASVTTYTISSMDGDAHEEYRIIVRLVAGASSAYFTLVLNNDTGANYGYQSLLGQSTTLVAGRSTGSAFTYVFPSSHTSGQVSHADMILYAKSGYVRTLLSNTAERISTTTIDAIEIAGHSWNNTADNITSMKFSSDVTSGIGIGSKFIIYKKVL